jgi:hypothetical protein
MLIMHRLGRKHHFGISIYLAVPVNLNICSSNDMDAISKYFHVVMWK